MDSPKVQLSFVQKNIIGYLRRFGGKLRYRELCMRMNYTQFKPGEWMKEYSDLLASGILREDSQASEKREGSYIVTTELVATDLIYVVRRLDEQKREAEENEWKIKGAEDFRAGIARPDFHKHATAYRYSRRWYVQREGWRAGWDEAKHEEEKMIDGVLE